MVAIVSRRRLGALGACVALALAGLSVGQMPVAAHSNTCATGSTNYVVIVFVNSGQTGANDDICWKSGHEYDDQFSVDEDGVDDIGENANFHDAVSSMSVKNFGSYGLCVRYFQDAFRSVLREKQWVGDGEGDVHFTALYNDNYDSLEMERTGQASCFS